MATIGTFKKTGDNELTGEIFTLSLQVKGVRIVPDQRATGENAPQPPRSGRFAPRSAPPGPRPPMRAATIWASSSTIRASTPRSTRTSSTTRKAKPSPSSGPARTAGGAIEPNQGPGRIGRDLPSTGGVPLAGSGQRNAKPQTVSPCATAALSPGTWISVSPPPLHVLQTPHGSICLVGLIEGFDHGLSVGSNPPPGPNDRYAAKKIGLEG
jgi:hypothetical protein